MQIIHIIPGKANPNTMNGVNKVVDAIAAEQTRSGYKTMVVGVASNTKKRHEPVYEYKLYTRSKIPFCYPIGMLEFLLEHSTEETVFHFHSVFIFWFLPLIKALKNNGRRHIVLTPHGQYIEEAMKPLKKRIAFSLFDSKVLREVEAVHVIGYKTENNAYINNNAKRVAIIPNGFGAENVREYPKFKELVIGYMGRLECKQKGLDILIPAFTEYKKNGGKGILRLAGSGPDEAKLKKMVSDAGMNDSVFFDGILYDDEKWKFLYSCSAFAHPSRWEGIPTACLEAAYVGCPLLITQYTNMGLYVTKYNAGIVFETLNIDSIKTVLFMFEQRFANRNELSLMVDAAQNMIADELNWVRITKRINNELYGLQ